MAEEKDTSLEVSQEAPVVDDQDADLGEELEAAGEPTAQTEAQPEDVSEEGKPLGRTGKYIKKLEKEREDALERLKLAEEEASNWRNETQRLFRQTQPGDLPKVEVDMSDLPKPRREDFDDPDDFEEARTFWISVKANRTETAKRGQQDFINKQLELENKKAAWGQEGRSRYADFDVVYTIPVTDTMRDEMFASEQGHEVAYFLGKNPTEAHRIATMLPVEQKVEIRKLAFKESRKKKPKTESTAPTATSPVGDREVVAKSWDINDPKIPYSEFKKIRMKQEREKLGLS